MKSSSDRITDALQAIDDARGNRLAAKMGVDRLGWMQRRALSDALSLGGRDDGTDAETKRRNALRGLLLLMMTAGKQPVSTAASLRARYEGFSLAQLQQEIVSRSPVVAASAGGLWSPAAGFTSPAHHDPRRFRYVVFGMMNTYTGRGMSYRKILQNPDMLTTFMLSTSIIDQNHVSTYYPYGFILSVPPENFVSASPKDQAFKNYKSVLTGVHVVDHDMRSEVMRVSTQSPIPASPQDILDGTSGRRGDTGYNEVVVLGTAPGGTRIAISGIFKKVDSSGGNFMRPGDPGNKLDKGPYVRPEIDGILDQLARQRNIPIVKITDASGENE